MAVDSCVDVGVCDSGDIELRHHDSAAVTGTTSELDERVIHSQA